MTMISPPLCIADDATFWPWRSWTDIARLSGRERVLVILPVAGFADWGLGQALDAEETVLMHVLRAAVPECAPGVRLLVLPPLRFVVGPGPECAFAVDPGVAHALIRELVDSVAVAGFRRVVLCNASPWNEELCAAAARDLRIERGLEMFCINLSALGLDFDPARGGDRGKLQTLLDALMASGGSTSVWIGFETDDTEVVPPWSQKGSKILEASAKHLAALLDEVSARGPLPRGGALPQMEAPP